MALLFLSLKKYRLRLHKRGFEAVQAFYRQGGEGHFFVILCGSLFLGGPTGVAKIFD